MSAMDLPQFLLDETSDERYLRANIYALLARLLASSADADLLQRLSALHITAKSNGPLNQAWIALAQAAQDTDVTTLRAEHQAIFIGVTRGEVMPYASWYRTGFLMEKPLADLRAELTRLSYARKVGIREPEDHVAALCEVMAQLIESAEPDQVDFFQRHMAAWLLKFFQDVQAAPSARFYRAVGQLGAEFVVCDSVYMGLDE